MNKNELAQAAGGEVKRVDAILKAMRLKTDAKQYTEDHLNMVKAAIAVMESGVTDAKEAVRQVKAAMAPAPKTKTAPKDEGAIAVTQTSAVVAEMPIKIPQEAQDTLEVVITTAAEEDLANLPATIATKSTQTGKQVEGAVQQMTNQVYFNTLGKKLKDPAFQEQVREAIKMKEPRTRSTLRHNGAHCPATAHHHDAT